MSFVCEFTLGLLINRFHNTLLNSSTRYKSYFADAMNYGITGSIAASQKALIDTMSVLTNNFQPKTIEVGVRNINQGRCESTYSIMLRIDGDIKTGFTFTEYDVFISRYCEPRFRQSLNWDNLDNKNLTLSQSMRGYNGAEIKNSYNQAFYNYNVVLSPNLAKVNTALENCQKYINAISSFGNSIPSS